MASLSLLGLCLLCVTHAAAGLHSAETVMFALVGDTVTLPCGLPSVTPCSSVNWNQSESVTEVVTAGRVTDPYVCRFGLRRDCSLQIEHLELTDARLYFCNSGAFSSSVHLQILQITENSQPANGTIELHCHLTTYKGYVPCVNRGLNITWTTERNTPLYGDRFHFKSPSECFSKLIITKKLTDHRRRWMCWLRQNNTSKASTSFMTTVKEGFEEVFAAVGESVSLSCGDTSSLSVGDSVKWVKVADKKGLTETSYVTKDSALLIRKVSPLHAGDYMCSESTGQHVFNRIRLNTLHVTSASGPDGENLTLTCVLTCTTMCEKDLNLTWSGNRQSSVQHESLNVNNMLMKRLFCPSLSTAAESFTCSVHREGAVMASERWHTTDSLQTLAWIALPLCLLLCGAAGGVYVFLKRRPNKGSENMRSSIGMTHVYAVMEDLNEDLHQQRNPKKEAVTTNDSFYDLLQAVN